jgi:DNA-binding NarL/FixJ family response regulator
VSSLNSRRRTTVCLYYSHPLLVPEFKRILPEEEFRLLVRRSDGAAPESVDQRISRASVYVLEDPGRQAGTEALAENIVSTHAGAKVLIIGEKLLEASMFPLLRLGARGMLTYSEVSTQLTRALHTINSGGYWVPRSLLSRFVEETLSQSRKTRPISSASIRSLSRREKEVLELLLQNLSNKEIAKELHISARTAKFHVSNLLSKHGVRRRADLILLTHARTDGVAPPVKA